jgi:hypothetical protein
MAEIHPCLSVRRLQDLHVEENRSLHLWCYSVSFSSSFSIDANDDVDDVASMPHISPLQAGLYLLLYGFLMNQRRRVIQQNPR